MPPPLFFWVIPGTLVLFVVWGNSFGWFHLAVLPNVRHSNSVPSSKRQPSGWTQHTSSYNMMWKCRDLVTYNENIEEGHRTQFWRRGLEGKMANSVNLGLLSMSLLIGYYVLGPAVGAGCYRVNNTDKNLYFHYVVVQWCLILRPWTAARLATMSFTISGSLLRLISI